MGLGGSIRYNREETFQYTEQEMRRRVRRLWFKAHRAGGIDLLLTHSPAAGLNDGDDRLIKALPASTTCWRSTSPSGSCTGMST